MNMMGPSLKIQITKTENYFLWACAESENWSRVSTPVEGTKRIWLHQCVRHMCVGIEGGWVGETLWPRAPGLYVSRLMLIRLPTWLPAEQNGCGERFLMEELLNRFGLQLICSFETPSAPFQYEHRPASCLCCYQHTQLPPFKSHCCNSFTLATH